jgi:hypothetical protein
LETIFWAMAKISFSWRGIPAVAKAVNSNPATSAPGCTFGMWGIAVKVTAESMVCYGVKGVTL